MKTIEIISLIIAGLLMLSLILYYFLSQPLHPEPIIEPIKAEEIKQDLVGLASWYDYGLEGYPDYSKTHLTCASRDFEKGTFLSIMNLENNKVAVCRVNDFGPDGDIHPDRIIDLSSFAFSQLAPLEQGLIKVSIREIFNK